MSTTFIQGVVFGVIGVIGVIASFVFFFFITRMTYLASRRKDLERKVLAYQQEIERWEKRLEPSGRSKPRGRRKRMIKESIARDREKQRALQNLQAHSRTQLITVIAGAIGLLAAVLTILTAIYSQYW